MSAFPVLRYGPVTLRPPLPTDITDRMKAGLVPEYVLMCGGDPQEQKGFGAAEVTAWYGRVLSEPLGWCIEVDGHCIGHARLHSPDWAHRRARYAIGIFAPSAWGHGYGTLATQLILQYAFDELSLHRVDLRVLAYNKRAIACYERCGFRHEGAERQSAWLGGRWHDDIMMSILEHEYHQLRGSWALPGSP